MSIGDGLHAPAALAAFVLLVGCAAGAQPPTTTASAQAADPAGSALAWTKPAAGSTVSAPAELQFKFAMPALLGDVTVTGPQGAMPMMVTPIGEVQDYALPLPDLAPGTYKVDWSASVQGREQRGSFGFTVR